MNAFTGVPGWETLYDREVTLVSAGEGVAVGRLTGRWAGVSYSVRIEYRGEGSEHTSSDFFTALARVRDDLQREGLKPAVQGACRDVYPSRMALEMGGGRRAYRWPTEGRPAIVDIFAAVPEADYDQLATTSEQSDLNDERRRRRNER
ncbi:hypothetical protein H9Y04_35540 [Streptomyces sp. TRM66268-LWL]|uniref:Uncharacterized protein n=1 Tax=Streptomyces polyasparticus TaxID=2767826 RepID=A0ABR7SR26_9ACTN|nr:hypothetical protein [Streptomyces polyasparticus]MBC9717859.1 hypothetical protein [Streptomyces polyasparticus]